MSIAAAPVIPERKLGDQPGYDAIVDAAMPISELRQLFRGRPELPGVMVVQRDELLGVISRDSLDRALVLPFRKELCQRRSVRWLLHDGEGRAICLDAETPLCDAVDAAMERPTDRIVEPIVASYPEGRMRLIEVPPMLRRQNEQYRRRIASQSETLDALRAAEERYRGLFEHAVEGIFQSTADGKVISANPALARIFGYETPEALMEQINDLGRQVYADPEDRRRFLALLQRDGSVRDFRTQMFSRDQKPIWVSMNARAITDERGRLIQLEGTIDDVSAQKQMEARLRDDALRDALTGLPNRNAMSAALSELVERSGARPDHEYALMFLDFDQFKLINDTLGHTAGDRFLCEVARRLNEAMNCACCRIDDQFSTRLARLGGDEFTVLLEGPGAADRADGIAGCMQRILSADYEVDGHHLRSTVSIGIVTSALGHTSAEDLLRDADIAMYAAKEAGKACHVVFDERMHEQAHAQLRLTNDLRRAPDRGELQLWYQPILSLADGKVHGFEALVRWEHPQQGMIGPDRFIPLAEDTGLILPIGWWVLEEACRQAAAWRQALPDRWVPISVNISKLQLFEPGFVGRVRSLFQDNALPPGLVQLELTESTIVEAGERIDGVLHELSDMGVPLMMDDFGTGYSSLSCLHRFPINILKLDRQFIHSIEARRDFSAVTQAVVSLAHNLKLKVVAEGVENNAQLAQLLALECDLVQGYLFSPPVPADRARFIAGSEEPLWQCDSTADAIMI